jgi:hypothetical protein
MSYIEMKVCPLVIYGFIFWRDNPSGIFINICIAPTVNDCIFKKIT